MREISSTHADKWLSDPDNLSNRFSGNMHLTREEALRIHAEKFGKSSEGVSSSTPGEVAAVPPSSQERGAPSGDVVSVPCEVISPKESRMTDAERAECAILALQIGPSEAAKMMNVDPSYAARLRDGERGNDLVKDVVEMTLAKVRERASIKLGEAIEGIDTSKLKPTEATQVAVGLATVIEKVENRGKNKQGVAVVYRTAGRNAHEYEEVELRVGA